MSPAPSSFFEVCPDGDRVLVRFTGCDSLNEYNSEAVGADLCRLAEGRQGLHLRLDLRAIRYATSSALGKLVGLHRRLRAAGGRLVLCGPTPEVAEVLSVTRLDTVLEVAEAPAGARMDPAA